MTVADVDETIRRHACRKARERYGAMAACKHTVNADQVCTQCEAPFHAIQAQDKHIAEVLKPTDAKRP